MSTRFLKYANLDPVIPEIRRIDQDGFVESGEIDKLRLRMISEGMPAIFDRTGFIRLIREEMAFRYMDMCFPEEIQREKDRRLREMYFNK